MRQMIPASGRGYRSGREVVGLLRRNVQLYLGKGIPERVKAGSPSRQVQIIAVRTGRGTGRRRLERGLFAEMGGGVMGI